MGGGHQGGSHDTKWLRLEGRSGVWTLPTKGIPPCILKYVVSGGWGVGMVLGVEPLNPQIVPLERDKSETREMSWHPLVH